MRLSLLCVWTSWILTLHTAAQHHPHREEGAVQPRQREGVLAGRRRHGTGRPSPPRLDANKPVAVRDPGERLGAPAGGRRRAALTGPHVCGGQCCVGWMLSPKTRRCTKPSCFPRCHNRALCRQSNRCVCRRGFHGPRCEFSTVTFSLPGWALTSICPTIIPHRPPVQFNPRHIPPGPTTVPQRTRPAQGHIPAARSGPTAISPLPASTRAAEPAATDLNPAETQDKELGAKIPHSGPAKSGLRAEGVYKRSPVLEENLASVKSEEVKMKTTTEEAQTKPGSKPGSKPEFNNLQHWTGDAEDTEDGTETTGKTLNLNSDPEPEAEETETRLSSSKISNVESTTETETQDRVDPGTWTENQNQESLSGSETKESSMTEDKSVIHQSDSAERLTTYTVPNLESSLRPEAETGGSLESKSGSGSGSEVQVEDRHYVKTSLKSEGSEGSLKTSQVEFDSGSKVENQSPASSKIPDLESNPGLRGERPAETRREEKKVKTGGAKKQTLSLREAQAVLLRKTLSRGGRGDKMAYLLLKHIEKGRKKVCTVTSSSNSSSSSTSSSSSSVKTSVKSFHTQKGQYTVHVSTPTGHELIDKQQQKQPASIPP